MSFVDFTYIEFENEKVGEKVLYRQKRRCRGSIRPHTIHAVEEFGLKFDNDASFVPEGFSMIFVGSRQIIVEGSKDEIVQKIVEAENEGIRRIRGDD